MSGDATFWLPESASTAAREIDFGWNAVLAVSIFFFVLVMGAMIYFVIRYRRRGDEIPSAPHESRKVEFIWTIIPIGIVTVLFFIGFRGYIDAMVAPADALEISVTAERWMWTFTYPEGQTSVNELHLPKDRPIKLVMSSKDVIHSFWIPEFRLKRDVLPGRYTTLWFEATRNGDWHVLCSEYCGTGHSAMLATVVVEEDSKFDKWLEESGGDKNAPPLERGQRLFTKMACNTCHSTDGAAKTGPSLKGIFEHEVKLASGDTVKADENYLRESMTNPSAKVVQGYQPVMPVFKGLLDQSQMDALITYIKSLQ